MTLKCILLAVSLTVAFSLSNANNFTFENGPYCAIIGCSKERSDHCRVNIGGSSCYCDQGCKYQCCPDYEAVCLNKSDRVFDALHTEDNCTEYTVPSDKGEQCGGDLCITDDNLINKVNGKLKPGWTAHKYNTWKGRNYTEGLNLRLGTNKAENPFENMTWAGISRDPLPSQYNAAQKFFSLGLSPIADQDWCAASWLLSTISVASDRFAIHSNGKEAVGLSAQHIYSCGEVGPICNGGYAEDAWNYLAKNGVVDDNCYKLSLQNNCCKIKHPTNGSLKANNCKPPVGVNRDSFYKVDTAYSLSGEDNIMRDIYINGPVQATMRVYRDFFSYLNGVYRRAVDNPGAPIGYHSVKLVGWGEHEGVKYWIAANSWGSWWGIDGYFHILRGNNECGIESYAVAAIPQVNINTNLKLEPVQTTTPKSLVAMNIEKSTDSSNPSVTSARLNGTSVSNSGSPSTLGVLRGTGHTSIIIFIAMSIYARFYQ